jgi:dihydroorotate dehydrogenase electron transfer subunit
VKQVVAEVIDNRQILRELKRRQDIPRPRPRDVLGSWVIHLRCPEVAYESRPGQFVMVRCGGECILLRPFSIHKVSDEGISLFFAVWEDGKGTKWLSERCKGETVEVLGPLGNGFTIQSGSRNLLLVAGGTGIAPLYFLAEQALKLEYNVKLLRGASGEYKTSVERNPIQHYPEELLPPELERETITSSPDGQKDMVTDLLPKSTGWADQVFACGPLPMYKAMAQMPELQDKSVQVSLEIRMGCGMGTCYACTIRTRKGLKQVCKDGPVFELNDIIWEEIRI